MLRFTLRQLEAFYWTAKLGTAHAAADHLSLTQPAVSTRIRELEGTLGLALFRRSQQRIELTAEGINALAYAERVLGAGQDLELLGRGASPLRGVLRLGADESSATVGMAETLTRLKARHPDLRIELTVDVGKVLSEKVEKRELDVALHSGGTTSAHVTRKPMGAIRFCWVAGQTSGFPAGRVQPAMLADLPIVTHKAPTTLHSLVDDWLRTGGHAFRTFHSCNSLALMLDLVRHGHAIAVLPYALLRPYVESGEVRILEADPPLPMAQCFISYTDTAQAAGVQAFIEVAQAVYADKQFFSPIESLPD
ncbi:DNA-binding transcriptional LysR family regulator [Comamonas sp. BIGb0124]|uniref:LysR family transcriptional regulator n=1 Tax=Comamonas sp. BIGb0124 TaxID=2485130 RepID=UPI000F490614|nr:LysR family transcriptional regulator [Comamonas sp. BIGb0124]ROR23124.1 DNA-binding transcriptional LysR family regulator [Comamonas sp. BIGb0124]